MGSVDPNFFQGFLCLEFLHFETFEEKYFVNEIPIILKVSESEDIQNKSLLVKIGMQKPYFFALICQKNEIIERSNTEYLILSPEYPFHFRIDVFGPSKIVIPYNEHIHLEGEIDFWAEMKPNTVRIRDVTVLDGLTYKIQIVKENEQVQYFIENPHKNVWINDLKGQNIVGVVPEKGLSLHFCYDKNKAKYDAEKKKNKKAEIIMIAMLVSFIMTILCSKIYQGLYGKRDIESS